MVELEKEYRKIELSKLEPNYWNVNKMSAPEFERLVKEIGEVGFVSPVEVVPIDGPEEKYQIIGGQHRYTACQALGYTAIDCIVVTDKKWQDEELRKLISVRLNVIHGRIDPEKFIILYEELEKKYGGDSLKDILGFTDNASWNKLTAGVKEALADTGLPKSTIDRFDEDMKEIKTVDGLSTVLNKIFNEHGDTINYNFVSFSYGSKEGLFVMCEDVEVYKAVKSLISESVKKKVRVDTALGKFIKGWKKTGIDDILPNVDDRVEVKGGAEY